MHIGKSNAKNPYYMKIEDEKQKFEVCNEGKDLGITFNSSLSFDNHTSNTSAYIRCAHSVLRKHGPPDLIVLKHRLDVCAAL